MCLCLHGRLYLHLPQGDGCIPSIGNEARGFLFAKEAAYGCIALDPPLKTLVYGLTFLKLTSC